MALPWAVAIAIEWIVFRRVFSFEAHGTTPREPRRRSRASRSP